MALVVLTLLGLIAIVPALAFFVPLRMARRKLGNITAFFLFFTTVVIYWVMLRHYYLGPQAEAFDNGTLDGPVGFATGIEGGFVIILSFFTALWVALWLVLDIRKSRSHNKSTTLSVGLIAAIISVWGSPFITVNAHAKDENPDPVFVFNRICYAQVHDLELVKTMALKLAWKSMLNAELKEFKTVDNPQTIAGWDVQVGERLFRVGVQKSELSDKQKELFPEFAKGASSTCTMVLDDQQEASVFIPNMQKLAGKKPISKDVPEGLLQTTTWAGGNDDLKVFLFAKAPATGKGGLLNVTVLQK